MTAKPNLLTVLSDLGKFLTFRAKLEDYRRFGLGHFIVGLVFVWLVGIARNWDYPEAPLFAKLGLPSVVYIFFMSGLLWLSLRIPSQEKHSYFKFLTIVALTAPPGLVYGIPVEMFMTVPEAQKANMVFLAIVSVWRVSLFAHFAIVACRMNVWNAILAMLTPICAIIIGLTLSGRIVFVLEIMGGLREDYSTTSQYAVNQFLSTLFCLSWPILGLGIALQLSAYSTQYYRQRQERTLKEPPPPTPKDPD